MNPWFDRYLAAAGADLDGLTREEGLLVLDLAGVTARGAGARQFAPLATYLAGRVAAAADPPSRLAALRRLVAAAGEAGVAAEDLGV